MSDAHLCFGFFREVDTVISSIITQSEQTFFSCFPCVGDSANENLTSPLRGSYCCSIRKIGIDVYRVQELMCERRFEEPLGKRAVLPPISKPKKHFLLGTASFRYVSLASLLVLGRGLPTRNAVWLYLKMREPSAITDIKW